MTEGKTKTRMTVLAALVAFMFAALSTRLWFLQVLATQEFSHLATRNRVRIVPEPAPRGRILDRNGNLLVTNRSTTVVTIDKSRLPEGQRDRVLFRLNQLLHVPVEELVRRMNDIGFYPYEPVPVAFNVPKEAAFYIREHQDLFPGVTFGDRGVRHYPHGALAAHVLGYTGEISPEQLQDPAYDRYREGNLVGKAGVEFSYERYLRGSEGLVNYEVDSRGKVLRTLGERPPSPGDDLVLAIDSKVQQLTDKSLELGIDLAHSTYDPISGRYLQAGGGAAVVMDPRNGQVLALSSLPQYDPRTFLAGLTRSEYRRLTAPSQNFPLLDRAIQSSYPPGSSIKPVVAAAAMKEKFASPTSTHNCTAEYTVPNDVSGRVFHNWKTSDSGYISLAQALIESCDTVFYRIGFTFYTKRQIYGEMFQKDMRASGYGHVTGIDLPSESPGLVPDRTWKADYAKSHPQLFHPDERHWLPGDDINMAIGQGFLQATPLQMATVFSAIANGGTLYEPHVGMEAKRPDGTVVKTIPPKVTGRLPYTRAQLAYIREALRGVPISGTAATAFVGFPLSSIPVAGKTGTADVPPKQPYSWFVAMAPADHPQYVVAVVVEQGGHGSQTAAPVVRRILEGLFGLPVEDSLHAGVLVD